MPNSVHAKTKSAPKVRIIWRYIRALPWFVSFAFILVMGSIGVVTAVALTGDQSSCELWVSGAYQDKRAFCVQLDRASTERERQQGLSDRPSMATDKGMLFVFQEDGKHCFWMKDMRFDLDMIWLDSDKQVVQVQPSVTPSTYPRTFCSDKPSRYVVEVNAGVADAAGLSVGKYLENIQSPR